MDFLLNILTLTAVYLFVEVEGRSYCATASKRSGSIAAKAERYIGSTDWSFTSKRRTGMNTDKDHIFVAEVVEWAGASVPHRRWYSWSPVTARDWGNPKDSDMKDSKCWDLVTSCYKDGDVIAGSGHVGIITGYGKTVHAARDRIITDGWGLENGNRMIIWRYVCK